MHHHQDSWSQTIFSGGDDCMLKVWDLRASSRPVQSIECFEAGVTCISSHDAVENLVSAGSYDETIALFDIRNMATSLLRTKPIGGGIWRMKWHPITPNRMLVAAMHGGCRVLNFGGGSFECIPGAVTWSSSKDSSFASSAAEAFYHPQIERNVGMKYKKTKEFTEHESMAYGADWFVYPHPTQNGYFEAAASCSFYDRAVFVWDSVF